MSIQIREGNISDLAHLLHHRRAMFEEMGFRDTTVLDRLDQASREYFTQALSTGAYRAWLAEDENSQVIGGGGIVLSPWPGFPGENLAQRAWILNMYTEPCARRKGVAKLLLKVMIDWCCSQGLSTVSLHASDAGRPIYESFGFRPTNEMRRKLP